MHGLPLILLLIRPVSFTSMYVFFSLHDATPGGGGGGGAKGKGTGERGRINISGPWPNISLNLILGEGHEGKL